MDVLMCLIICLLWYKRLASFVHHDEIVYNLGSKIQGSQCCTEKIYHTNY